MFKDFFKIQSILNPLHDVRMVSSQLTDPCFDFFKIQTYYLMIVHSICYISYFDISQPPSCNKT